MRRRLHEHDFYAKQPATRVPRLSRHRRERFQWARQHVHWTRDQWRAILFTDESRSLEFRIDVCERGHIHILREIFKPSSVCPLKDLGMVPVGLFILYILPVVGVEGSSRCQRMPGQ
ncbi:hypothetical protein TNCV_1540811 [Trichonephila clavipes]|nr:hypothetical protein TNCV_1540811 [Trichonephila clavipes]